MKTITMKEDGQSTYAFADDAPITLGADGTHMPDGSTDISVTSETAELWENVTPPSNWQPTRYCFNGTNWTPNPLWVDPNAEKRKEQEELRKVAYPVESDPIFFMAQRGEATMDEWTAKVAEIKARYPYPTEA